MKSILASPWFTGLATALIWIIISFSTGGSAAFSIGGGVAVGVVAFVITYLFHRQAVNNRNRAA
jgi:predicted membrane protein